MTFNDFVAKVQKFEGYSANAYKCPAGKWTIGYGRTAGVNEGDITTVEIEVNWLVDRLMTDRAYVTNYIHENTEWDLDLSYYNNTVLALTDFVFNCGRANFAKLLSGRSLLEVADAITLYNKAGGKVLKGLVARRDWERDLILYEVQQPAQIAFKLPIKGWVTWQGKCLNDHAVCKDKYGRTILVPESNIMSLELPIQFIGKKN